MAVAASGLVAVEGPDDDRLTRVGSGLPVDEPLGRRRGPTAAVTHGLQLVDELRAGEQRGHRPERETAEVLVEAGGDHADPAVGQGERGVDDRLLEELDLVDSHCLASARAGDELGRAVDRDRRHPNPRVADDVVCVVAVVDLRLEQEHPLTGDLRAPKSTDHLLALAAEHRAADHLEPASTLRGDSDHAAGS
jgi:hypothetical protein